ncbi:MAG: S49 family peptidase, partial [Planctomycetaceae bacterium]|nr:S49 family peptidase [Planctomycetaceae bacterium]
FGEITTNLRDLITRLDRARNDKNVSAVQLRIRDSSIGRGKLQELRAAIHRTREAGKKVYADVQSPTTSDYLLACACDEIIMPESGTLMITGLHAEFTFYKQLFDRLEIHADILQVGDFKGAGEPYTRDQMSEAFRQQYDAILDDYYAQMVETIAQDRGLKKKQVRKLIDQGLFTAKAAKKAGL